jgi:hypothetical protein
VLPYAYAIGVRSSRQIHRRATYRLTTGELDRLNALLAEAGLGGAVLLPRRTRTRRVSS